MSNPSLRSLFTAGQAVPSSAQNVFTDRIPEVEAFERSLAPFRTWGNRPGPSPVVDVSQGRTNVLVYYGIGGIGKTALSKHLEQRFGEWSFPGEAPRRVAVRVDFDDGSSLDLESFILRLRAGLAALGSKWPAFDLAFSVYWERAHPGEPLRQFLHANSTLRRIAARVGLSNQIESSLGDLTQALGAPATPIQSGYRIARVVYDQVKQAVTNRRLLASCPFFEPLIEADANDDTLSYMASLLAWDLEAIQSSSPTVAVVFLDTFEAVTGRARRTSSASSNVRSS